MARETGSLITRGVTIVKTDAQVQQDVIAELNWDPAVNAAKIGVEVNEGVVTLAGYVESFAEKWNAEQAAQRVSGVAALAVEIEVVLPGQSQRKDADIAHTAESILHWMTNLPKDAIKVMVEDGWITLSGDVDWEYQRRAAVKAVHSLMGVIGVSDQIALKHKVSKSVVKTDIEAALKRRAKHEAQKITVAIQGGDVTLSGTVDSWAERDLAIDSAWGSPGVLSVKADIKVDF
jgi:osmotically-inducible protein OsmY